MKFPGRENFLHLVRCSVVGFLLLLGGLSGGEDVEAVTNLSFPNDTFPNGYILTTANSPYLIQSSSIKIATGTTVTIEPGVIIKMKTGLRFPVQIFVDGILNANGAAESPIVFTSDRDDTYGGDTNNDGSNTVPSPGDWFRISIEGKFDAKHAIIRYGGAYDWPMLLVGKNSHVLLDYVVIEYGFWEGIKTFDSGSTISITNSIIRNNTDTGLRLQQDAFASITNSLFYNNKIGILAVGGAVVPSHIFVSNSRFYSNSQSAVFYPGDDLIDMTNNWWGDDSGPRHVNNPGGTGDIISGNILFDPWTNQAPTNQSPTLSYVGTSGYIDDGVEPNVNFKNPANVGPVFKALYSDPENIVFYVRLVMASSTVAMATSTGGIYEYSPSINAYSKGVYNYHFEASDGTNTARLPATGELTFEVKNIPVLLVPGIMGTEMWKGSDKIWPDIGQMFSDNDDQFMNILAINSDGIPNDIQVAIGDIVRKPVPTKDVFIGLISQFINLGYQENTDLFVLPYDWRLDIRTTSISLKNKIEAIKNQTNSTKIDVIAHSMGGLLTKQYILDNGANAINKLVFIGTPHLGAPLAAKALLFGDNLSVKLVFPFLDPERVRYISQNMPALYELLPSRAFLDQEYYYYDHTQSNVFDFERTKQFLADSGLNPILLQSADNFHSSSLDNFNATGLNAYNINGCNTPTITTIIKRGNSEYGMFLYEGDGTVPLISSKAINISSDKTYYFKGIEHATMPSASGIKELVANIITDFSIVLSKNATQDLSVCKVVGQLVSVHSPVNLHIYDSLGNHVGRGENGDIEYEISGVAYEEIGENKFVFLPTNNDETYQIMLDGTGSGTFSLRVSKIEDSQVSETAYYSNLPVNTATEATVILTDDISQTMLLVSPNGTDGFELAPISAVLDSTQAADISQPESMITVVGGQTAATISLSATDDNSGVLKIEYSLDNGALWNTYSSSFIINTLGSNTVLYRAIDRAGNVEASKSKVIEITALPSVVAPLSSPSFGGTIILKQNLNNKPVPQVLGEEVKRPVVYIEKNSDNNLLESKIIEDYGKYLVLDEASVNFIAYGTEVTNKLGRGERVNILRSYQYAFAKMPQSQADWQDVINIATGKLPIQRNKKVEQEARAIVRKIYGKSDNQSIMMIAYGLRPQIRDLKKEQIGLSRFGRIFKRMPNSVMDWNIFRKLVY